MTAKRRKPSDPTIEASSVSLVRLDEEGQPVGEPEPFLGANVTVAFEPVDMELPALDPGPYAPMGAAKPLVASVPVSNIESSRIPIPTAVIDRWFPAFVHWPGQGQAASTCKVYLTPQGLYVYKRVPNEPETFKSGAQPKWYSPVDFEKTAKPARGSVIRNAGIHIVTDAGTVTVQQGGPCGCGGRLNHWTPGWTRNSITWEDGVRLAATATEGR